METTPAWPHLSTDIMRRKATKILILIRIDDNSSSRFIEQTFQAKNQDRTMTIYYIGIALTTEIRQWTN